jgi:hypothetical protein
MEETNYDRKHFDNNSTTETDVYTAPELNTNVASNEKKTTGEVNPRDSEDHETGEVILQRKTYWDKLGFKDKKRPNRLVPIMIAPFVGFTYMPVVYAGYVLSFLSNGSTRSHLLTNVSDSCMAQTTLFGKVSKMLQLEPYIPQNMGSVPRPSLLHTQVEFSARSSGKLELS